MHCWRLGAGALSALIAIVPRIVSLTELCHCPSIPSDGKKKEKRQRHGREAHYFLCGDLTHSLTPLFFSHFFSGLRCAELIFSRTPSISFTSPSSILTQLMSFLPPPPPLSQPFLAIGVSVAPHPWRSFAMRDWCK